MYSFGSWIWLLQLYFALSKFQEGLIYIPNKVQYFCGNLSYELEVVVSNKIIYDF